MTPEEWKRAESALEVFFNTVEFDIDGYRVSVQLVRVSIYKNALAVYVNGVFKGEWLIADCEERRRFLPCKSKPLFSKEKMEKMRKELKMKKREFERFASEHNTAINYFSKHWTSFSALKKHFIANNTNIRLIKPQE